MSPAYTKAADFGISPDAFFRVRAKPKEPPDPDGFAAEGTLRSESPRTSTPVPILSSREFVAGFTPPDYLLDGILQRGFIYSLTGRPGDGKTAISMLIAAHVGLGRFLGSREVQQGSVLVLCGENPDDVRMRWIGMGEEASFETETIPVFFMPGIFDIIAQRPQIEAKAREMGGLAFSIVDTSPAYFRGDEENSNTQLGVHARNLRTLTTLPGHPTVIANCHPAKGADPGNLIPRGGSSFLGEIDGNLTAVRDDRVVRLHWAGKFRGPDFEAIPFELVPIKTPRLVDSKGRQIPTVMARTLTPTEETSREEEARKDEDAILAAMRQAPGASVADLAEAVGWKVLSGAPHKSKADRVLHRLKAEKLVEQRRGKWGLTKAGQGAS